MADLIKKTPAIVYIIALAGFGVQMWAGLNYDMFRDEFYYLECARHLDWGYVDHPPFSILKLWAWISFFGDSQVSIRIIPSVLFSLIIILSSFITKSMKGSPFSQIITALAVFSCPQYLGLTGFYSMNAFDLFFWALLFLILLFIINTENQKLWLLFGLFFGIALMNKFTIGVLAISVSIGVYFTHFRKITKNFYYNISSLVAILIFLPFMIWNYSNGFPTIEFMRNASLYKNADIGLGEFFLSQIISMGPVNSFLWLGGLGYILLSARMSRYRFFGYIYIITFFILSVFNSKPYYMAGAYFPLISAGAIAVTSFSSQRMNKSLGYASAALLLISFIVFSPMAIPVLPPERFIEYSAALGFRPLESERHEQGELPQHFADRFGWRELTDEVASAYYSLPEDERKRTAIYGQNYGEAGAVTYYGRSKGLPPAISGHNSYWLWGPGTGEIKTVIIIGGEIEDHLEAFEDVVLHGRVMSRFSMPYENDLPVYIARKPKAGLIEIWNETKHYN